MVSVRAVGLVERARARPGTFLEPGEGCCDQNHPVRPQNIDNMVKKDVGSFYNNYNLLGLDIFIDTEYK